MNIVKLKDQTKQLPSRPGIYLFKNTKGKPLYIGKALNLKKRVRHYLKVTDPRLTRMIKELSRIDFIKTESDIEALILESQYIKKYKPDFNIMLRDDKQYGFVGFTHSTSSGQAEEFPKIFITHQPTKVQNAKLKNYKSDFIGPFTNLGALKTTLRHLRKIFPYCTCKTIHNNYCLNYHLGNCPGLCCLKLESKNEKVKIATQKLKLKEYKRNINAINSILSGKKNSLLKNLEKEMKKMAKEERFEEAMELQKKIESIKWVFQNAQIIQRNTMIYHSEKSYLESLQKFFKLPILPKRIEAYDIANIQGKHATGAMVVFENGKPNKNEYRKFRINMFRCSTSKHGGGDIGMLREILTRRFNHPEWPMPDIIIVDGGKGQLNAAIAAINSKSETLNPKQIQNSKFKIQNKIPIIALTKDKRHRGTKIYIAGKKNALPLSKLPEDVKNLILEIDTEVHRFAINYYRQIHRRTLMKKPAINYYRKIHRGKMSK